MLRLKTGEDHVGRSWGNEPSAQRISDASSHASDPWPLTLAVACGFAVHSGSNRTNRRKYKQHRGHHSQRSPFLDPGLVAVQRNRMGSTSQLGQTGMTPVSRTVPDARKKCDSSSWVSGSLHFRRVIQFCLIQIWNRRRSSTPCCSATVSLR